jgi:rhodanese-related sulfurtransferase
MNANISCVELRQLFDRGGIVLVDVMTPEDYERCHVAGAHNACVYEMAFLERIVECGVNHETALVIYDATGKTRTAETAREKLIRAQYRSVTVLTGGLSAWRSAGYPVEGANQDGITAAPLRDGNYSIDLEKSKLEWMGRNMNKRHYGRIAIAGGELTVRNALPTGGRIELDMSAISNLDLQDEGWRDLLIRHLKSDDFFEVARFPTATFDLTDWEPVSGAPAGSPNGIAKGSLIIKDASRPVSFPAIVSREDDGSINAHAALDIDRTLWNVCYGSGKLYERLGMHLVHDLISLELFVVARWCRAFQV